MFCSCFPFRDFVSGEILESERIKDRREKIVKVGVRPRRGKGTRVVDKVIASLAKAVSGGNCDVGRKLAGGCVVSRCSTGGATISSALQITFLLTEISNRMWHPLQDTLRLK